MAKKSRKKGRAVAKPVPRRIKTLALIKDAQYNPVRLAAFRNLHGKPGITVFHRPDPSSIHDVSDDVNYCPIQLDTEAGPILRRWRNRLSGWLRQRTPSILPFHEDLECFDLLHSWDLYTAGSAQALIARQRKGMPLCVTVWDTIPFHLERNPERRRRKESIAAAADRLIVHTEPAQRMLEAEGIDARRLVVMDPAVDTALFSPGPGPRASFGLNPDDFVLHFPGWLLPRKGIEFLLLALNELIHDQAHHGANVRLLIAGSGPGCKRIEYLMRRLNEEAVCVFTGPLDYAATAEVLRAADLAILPGVSAPEWQEHYTLSLLETMACGVPVLTTPSGALPDGLENAVVLSRPDDFVSLYEAVKDLIQNLRRRSQLANDGQQLIASRFTIQKQAGQLSSLYEQFR